MFRVRVDHKRYANRGAICANVDPVQSYEMCERKAQHSHQTTRGVGIPRQQTSLFSPRSSVVVDDTSTRAGKTVETKESLAKNSQQLARLSDLSPQSTHLTQKHEMKGSPKVGKVSQENDFRVSSVKNMKTHPCDLKKGSPIQRIQTAESKESGIQDDIDESIDDFIEELEALETSLEPSRKDGRKSSKSCNAMDVLLERMKSTLDEETASSKEFLKSVQKWKCSSEIHQARTMTAENEERYRREWFQNRFSRQSSSEKKSTVSERLQKRKEKIKSKKSES